MSTAPGFLKWHVDSRFGESLSQHGNVDGTQISNGTRTDSRLGESRTFPTIRIRMPDATWQPHT